MNFFWRWRVKYFVLVDDTYLDEVNDFFQSQSAETRSDVIPSITGELYDNETPLVLTAWVGEKLVGAAWGAADFYMLAFLRSQERDPLEFKRCFGVLHQFAVSEGHRRRGLGRKLVRRLESLLAKRNVEVLGVLYHPSEQLTRFYNKLGYQTGITELELPLVRGERYLLPVDDPDRWAHKRL